MKFTTPKSTANELCGKPHHIRSLQTAPAFLRRRPGATLVVTFGAEDNHAEDNRRESVLTLMRLVRRFPDARIVVLWPALARRPRCEVEQWRLLLYGVGASGVALSRRTLAGGMFGICVDDGTKSCS
ncbi:MAG: hypothetical protein ACRC46_05835 [Thermoguttaceae bacterium]